MASRDRILRLKEETRANILNVALEIVKKEGWPALSMRKIADGIEYTAPIIYEYFSNKEAILLELTKQGYDILFQDIQNAKAKHRLPEHQLEAMWLAYWHFAFANKERYQLMYGVSTNCCCNQAKTIPESQGLITAMTEVISKIMGMDDVNSNLVCTKFYTFWSVVHGLISINLLSRGSSEAINRQVLKDAIVGITHSISK